MRQTVVNYSEAIAGRALKKAGISRPPVNPVTVAISLGVMVKFVFDDIPPAQIFQVKDKYYLIVKVHNDHEAMNFAIAQQLGHLCLNHFTKYKMDTPSQNKLSKEVTEYLIKEASDFANKLLMPELWLKRYFKKLSIQQITETKYLFNVTYKTLFNRLIETGFATPRIYSFLPEFEKSFFKILKY